MDAVSSNKFSLPVNLIDAPWKRGLISNVGPLLVGLISYIVIFKIVQFIRATGVSTKLSEKYYTDLTKEAAEGKYKNLKPTDRDLSYLEKIKKSLSDKKPFALLVGDPGSGRDTLFKLLAIDLNNESKDTLSEPKPIEQFIKYIFSKCFSMQASQEPRSSPLRGKKILLINIPAIEAGCVYTGMFRQRLQNVFDHAKKENAIVAIPDLRSIVSSNSNKNGMYKRNTDDTQEILLDYLKKDAFPCLAKTAKDVATKDDELIYQFHKISIQTRTTKEIAEVSSKCIKQNASPIDFQTISKYILTFIPIQGRMNKCIQVFNRFFQTNNLSQALREVTTIPFPISPEENHSLINLEKKLQEKIFGQEQAVLAISSACRKYLTGMGDPNRPIGVFLFLGPTGTGKTELSLTIANELFHGNCVRLNMQDFQHGLYIQDIKKQLSSALQANPFSVVLLDEVDCAKDEIRKFFLTAFDAGFFTDEDGRDVDCRQALFLMSSNFGAELFAGTDSEQDLLKKLEMGARKIFTSQFVARINKIIPFFPLSDEYINKIIEKELISFQKEINQFPNYFILKWDDEVLKFFKQNYNKEKGARSVRDLLGEVRDKISIYKLQGNPEKEITLIVKGDELLIQSYGS